MRREDRISAGMPPEKVSQVYAVLKERFEKQQKKEREAEALRRSVLPQGGEK